MNWPVIKLTVLLSLIILSLTSCNQERKLYGEWMCTSGNFYNGARFWFLRSKTLIIAYQSNNRIKNIGISGYKDNYGNFTPGIGDSYFDSNSIIEKKYSYSISGDKITLKNRGETYEFQIKSIDENELIILNNGIIINLKR